MNLGFFVALTCCLVSYALYENGGHVEAVFVMGSNVTVMIMCLIEGK